MLGANPQHTTALSIDMLHVHFFFTMSEEYMSLYLIQIVIDQNLQLSLQCYFNGHAVAPLMVAGAFLITCFWLHVTSLGLCPLTV